MPACIACKNKQSNDRCTNSALNGVLFCGVHSRTKTRRIWTVINNVDTKLVAIQKVWRGYMVRKLLKLAGPGALKRITCNNQDELISLEPISSVNPLNYFGFEENGKIYGFDIRTIIDALHRTGANPFTRQPLTIECRRRVRELYGYRMRNKLENYYEHNGLKTPDSLITDRWTQVCQIIEENGFYNLHPNIFLHLNKSQIHVFLNMVCNDIQIWAAEHKRPDSRRLKYYVWLRRALGKMNRTVDVKYYSFLGASVLAMILYDCVDSYNICFIIMSALYRL